MFTFWWIKYGGRRHREFYKICFSNLFNRLLFCQVYRSIKTNPQNTWISWRDKKNKTHSTSCDYGAASGVLLNRHCFVLLEVNGKVAFDHTCEWERFCARARKLYGQRFDHYERFSLSLKWHWKVIQGQRSWRTLTKSTIRNIFCYRHQWPTGNGLAATGDFHFRDLKDPFVVIKVKVMRIRILGTKFVLVS